MTPAADLLVALSGLIGPAGHEQVVRDRLRELVAAPGVEWQQDALGSLYWRYEAGGGRRLLLLVPMDEPGVVLTHLDRQGRGALAPLGSISAADLVGRRVRFPSGALAAVGVRRGWDEEKPATGFDRLVLDFGLPSREAVEAVARTGEAAVWDAGAAHLPGGQVCGRAVGARAGCAAAVLGLRAGCAANAVVAFLAQSAVGHRGVRPAVARAAADLIVSVEAVSAVEPGADPDKEGRAEVRLGAGPALVVQDRGLIASAPAMDALARAADAAGVQLQVAVADPGQVAAGPALTAGAGAPAAALGIPVRYRHTAAEVCAPADVEAAAAVLAALLSSVTP